MSLDDEPSIPVLHRVTAQPARGAAPSAPSARVAAQPRPPASLAGTLSALPVPELLEFMRGSRRSGLLAFRGGAGLAALRFRDGKIVGATVPGMPRLGQVLAYDRKLSPAAVEAVAARATEARVPVGELLVRAGLVDPEAVEHAVTRQIQHAVKQLVRWEDGEFTLSRDGDGAVAQAVPVAVDPQAALLEAFRQLDEAARDGEPR
ncbi:DUF4388 domain-containing protein [Anaeromyxobacter diazotrophicus]|nr:DUF4388 domain-containing protein [Anaeromyxobacter diazotrophicus]